MGHYRGLGCVGVKDVGGNSAGLVAERIEVCGRFGFVGVLRLRLSQSARQTSLRMTASVWVRIRGALLVAGFASMQAQRGELKRGL